jgi:hypothetical protein
MKQCGVSPGTPSPRGRIGIEGFLDSRTLSQNPEASRQTKRLKGEVASVERRVHFDELSSEDRDQIFSSKGQWRQPLPQQ